MWGVADGAEAFRQPLEGGVDARCPDVQLRDSRVLQGRAGKSKSDIDSVIILFHGAVER